MFENLYEDLIQKKTAISVIGMGYVGMPLAVAFSKDLNVIGFDLNKEKINLYKQGIDPTEEVGNEVIANSSVNFTYEIENLKKAKFHIVAVPTPINLDKTPDLTPILGASKMIGEQLQKGSIVVYESTVYPGVTEDVCIPILEEASGLICGVDFKVAYSPERINPGDKNNRLENIVKIVSGMDSITLDIVAKVYEIVVKVGVYRASTIKVAEAAKVVENSQRDINIAFMNELAMVFDKMNIDTDDVVKAMNTKWNALKFTPGLVGGHCIGVDPYYFIYQAENIGYSSQLISMGRKINDGMGEFIADATIKQLILADKKVKGAKVAVLGMTFKENCPDTRNSKVIDVIERLKEYAISPLVVDPYADKKQVVEEYGIELIDLSQVKDVDCLIFAVAHDDFKNLGLDELEKMYAEQNEKIIIDIKSIFEKTELNSKGFKTWRL